MSPKRGAHPRDFREAAVSMLQEGRKPRELAGELGVTPGTLRVWLLRAEGRSHLPDRTRELVVGLTVQAYERLDNFLRRLRKSALDTAMPFSSEAIDPWTVKDAVAHVTHYKARVAERLIKSGPPVERRMTATERALQEYWDPEWWAELEASDRVLRTLDVRTRRRHGGNHLVYVRWRDRTADEVLSWHRMVHKYVVSILEGGPETWFLPSRHRASRGNISYGAVSNISTHSDQHLRDIRRALGTSH